MQCQRSHEFLVYKNFRGVLHLVPDLDSPSTVKIGSADRDARRKESACVGWRLGQTRTHHTLGNGYRSSCHDYSCILGCAVFFMSLFCRDNSHVPLNHILRDDPAATGRLIHAMVLLSPVPRYASLPRALCMASGRIIMPYFHSFVAIVSFHTAVLWQTRKAIGPAK